MSGPMSGAMLRRGHENGSVVNLPSLSVGGWKSNNCFRADCNNMLLIHISAVYVLVRLRFLSGAPSSAASANAFPSFRLTTLL
eukprot:5219180-Pyramimonas_sp.AAC.1